MSHCSARIVEVISTRSEAALTGQGLNTLTKTFCVEKSTSYSILRLYQADEVLYLSRARLEAGSVATSSESSVLQLSDVFNSSLPL